MYTYVGFGLNIKSALEFPELMPSNNTHSDLVISLAPLRTDLGKTYDLGQSFYEWKDGMFVFHVPDVGAFVARNGSSIEVDPYPDGDQLGVRSFMLNTMLPAALSQRRFVLMHGSSLIVKDKLALFLGSSGAGKSSMAAELRRRGYKVFSDDVFVLLPPLAGDRRSFAVASYPMMKLKKDTIQSLGDAQNTEQYPIRVTGEKFAQYFHESFQTDPYPVGWVFLLNPSQEHAGYSVKTLGGMEAFEALARNTYRSNFMHERGLQRLHAEALSHLIRTVKIQELSRPVQGADIASFASFVLSLT